MDSKDSSLKAQARRIGAAAFFRKHSDAKFTLAGGTAVVSKSCADTDADIDHERMWSEAEAREAKRMLYAGRRQKVKKRKDDQAASTQQLGTRVGAVWTHISQIKLHFW